MSPYTDEDVDNMLEKHKDLFKDLASGVLCPKCGKVAQPPLANLGKDFNWAEGHPGCLKAISINRLIIKATYDIITRERKRQLLWKALRMLDTESTSVWWVLKMNVKLWIRRAFLSDIE